MVHANTRSCFGSNSCFPQFKFCCCGCSLRTGVLILGWYTVIVGVFSIIGFWPVVNSLKGIDTSDNPEAKLAIFLWVIDFFIDSILLRIAAIFLLIGVYTEKPKYVLLYLIAGVISAIKLGIEIPLFTFTNIGSSVMVKMPSLDTYMPLFQHPLVLLIAFVLTLYYLAVTNSYYIELENTPSKRSETELAENNVRIA